WKIQLIGAHERYLPTANGTQFSPRNQPVETQQPKYHHDKAGFSIDVATHTGKTGKLEWWAQPRQE
ncbi:protein deglycase HchA, partial [Aeromonas veronii]